MRLVTPARHKLPFGALRGTEIAIARGAGIKKAPELPGLFKSLEEFAEDQYFVEIAAPPQLKR